MPKCANYHRHGQLSCAKLPLAGVQVILPALQPAGMMRATRVPLGHACMVFVKAGEKDISGKVVTEEGYYYQTWKGLYCLTGKKGLNAGHYLIRLKVGILRYPGLAMVIECIKDDTLITVKEGQLKGISGLYESICKNDCHLWPIISAAYAEGMS